MIKAYASHDTIFKIDMELNKIYMTPKIDIFPGNTRELTGSSLLSSSDWDGKSPVVSNVSFY